MTDSLTIEKLQEAKRMIMEAEENAPLQPMYGWYPAGRLAKFAKKMAAEAGPKKISVVEEAEDGAVCLRFERAKVAGGVMIYE